MAVSSALSRGLWRGLWVAALLGVAPLPARAQRPISPGNVPPGSSSLATPVPADVLPQGSPIPRILPSAPPAVAPGAGVTVAAPSAVPSATVAIRSVTVNGMTAYVPAQTQAITAGLVGPAVSLARIEAARTALLNLYRGDGYAFTTVTATVERDGTLRYVVLEGRIAEVKLDGDIGPAGTQVLRFLDHLTTLRPLDTASLERWLLLAQDVPGVTVRAVLRPSAGEPGALTLVAQVQRQKFDALATVDNRAARVTGPVETLALLDLNSFTEFGERTEFSVYHADGNTQNFGQGSIEAFIGGSGLRGRLYGGYGQSNPSGFLRNVNYQGTTTVFGGALTYPLIRARQQTLNLGGYFDAIETQVTQALGGSGLQRGFDSLRVLRLGADYAQQDAWLGDARPAISTVNVRYSQGLPSLGAASSGASERTRPGERVDFSKVVLDVSRVQTLFPVGADSSVSVRGRLIGQYSDEVLPPSEKFFLGGPEYTRGFYSGEVTGDKALVYSAELQFNTAYQLALFDRVFPINAQFYAFYDHGEAWQNQLRSVEVPYTRVSSEGIGVRLDVTQYTEFNLEGVHRNTTTVDATSTTASRLKGDALFWRVIGRF